MTSSSYKHMNLDDRLFIEQQLEVPDITLKIISSSLGRDDKTIREEIKKGRFISIPANRRNKCGRQLTCSVKRLCTHCVSGLCKGCTHDNCNELCSEFTDEPVCHRILRFPFVCSCCPDLSSCKLPKFFYKADKAQARHNQSVREWKTGPKKSPADMKTIISAFEKGVHNGISPDIIIHSNNLNIATSTAYRYINNHQMGSVIPLDLKRAVSYKPQNRSKPMVSPINYDYLNGRRYSDFCELLPDLPPSVNLWEMDTVKGKKEDSKCVLSLLHRKSNLQLYFLLESCTMLEVQRVFDGIKGFLGPEEFSQVFSVILTDNGSEFHDPINLETDPDSGEKLISVYFCRPRRSDDKAKCEKNHEHFREIIPKGTSMEPLSRNDIRYISNMVNNYPRKELGYNSPYQLAAQLLPKKVLALNKLHFIPTDKVKLTPITK